MCGQFNPLAHLLQKVERGCWTNEQYDNVIYVEHACVNMESVLDRKQLAVSATFHNALLFKTASVLDDIKWNQRIY